MNEGDLAANQLRGNGFVELLESAEDFVCARMRPPRSGYVLTRDEADGAR